MGSKYPTQPGHMLLIPNRHVSDFFKLGHFEVADLLALLYLERDALSLNPKITGYNIGINVGKSAGQTVFHAHVHLIPRYGTEQQPGTVPGKWMSLEK
jgi:diadenosine tetraphosphate (Ap4A) HIT family hydrolase